MQKYRGFFQNFFDQNESNKSYKLAIIDATKCKDKENCYFAKHVLLTKGFNDRLKTYKRIRARKWCKIIFLMEQKKQHMMKLILLTR